jgi:prevent-host-death family protein
VTFLPSQLRSTLSSTMRIDTGRREEPVYISRRGEPAGVLMSVAQFERLQSQSGGPIARWLAWRAKYAKDLEDWTDETDPWADVRDRTPPRPVTWTDDIADPDKA